MLALYFSPKNDELEKVVRMAADSLDIPEVVGFNSAADLEVALRQDVFTGIEFDDSLAAIEELPESLSYSLRFPSELRTQNSSLKLSWFTMMLFSVLNIPGPRNPNSPDGGTVGYIREGFIPVQHAITSSYIKIKGNIETLPEILMQRFPYPAYIDDPLLEGLASIFALIILLSFIYPCTYITKVVYQI